MKAENRAAHAGRTAVVTVVTVILAGLLVFPGFLAAGLSRGAPRGSCSHSSLPVPALSRAYSFATVRLGSGLRVVLVPAERLMQVPPAVAGFYDWQYNAAGGSDLPRTI